MSDTRRGFLKSAAAGLGSIAAAAVGAESASACCLWKSSSSVDVDPRNRSALRDPERGPSIKMDIPIDDAVVARTFTASGTFLYEINLPASPAPVSCVLTVPGHADVNGYVTWFPSGLSSGERTWMADFTIPETVPAGKTGMKLTAWLLNTNQKAYANNLSLFGDGNGGTNPPPIIITDPGSSMPLVGRSDLLKQASPHGEVNDPAITSVTVQYRRKGYAFSVEHTIPVVNAGKRRVWRMTPYFFNFAGANHLNRDEIALVVKAVGTGGKQITISEPGMRTPAS